MESRAVIKVRKLLVILALVVLTLFAASTVFANEDIYLGDGEWCVLMGSDGGWNLWLCIYDSDPNEGTWQWLDDHSA